LGSRAFHEPPYTEPYVRWCERRGARYRSDLWPQGPILLVIPGPQPWRRQPHCLLRFRSR
jgi:hypothetical protein